MSWFGKKEAAALRAELEEARAEAKRHKARAEKHKARARKYKAAGAPRDPAEAGTEASGSLASPEEARASGDLEQADLAKNDKLYDLFIKGPNYKGKFRLRREKVDAWVNAQVTEKRRIIAKKVAEHIEYVDHDTFVATVRNLVNSRLDVFQKERVCFFDILRDPTRSNFWVGHMAASILWHEHGIHIPFVYDKKEATSKFDHIVDIDDCAYTGSQISMQLDDDIDGMIQACIEKNIREGILSPVYRQKAMQIMKRGPKDALRVVTGLRKYLGEESDIRFCDHMEPHIQFAIDEIEGHKISKYKTNEYTRLHCISYLMQYNPPRYTLHVMRAFSSMQFRHRWGSVISDWSGSFIRLHIGRTLPDPLTTFLALEDMSIFIHTIYPFSLDWVPCAFVYFDHKLASTISTIGPIILLGTVFSWPVPSEWGDTLLDKTGFLGDGPVLVSKFDQLKPYHDGRYDLPIPEEKKSDVTRDLPGKGNRHYTMQGPLILDGPGPPFASWDEARDFYFYTKEGGKVVHNRIPPSWYKHLDYNKAEIKSKFAARFDAVADGEIDPEYKGAK